MDPVDEPIQVRAAPSQPQDQGRTQRFGERTERSRRDAVELAVFRAGHDVPRQARALSQIVLSPSRSDPQGAHRRWHIRAHEPMLSRHPYTPVIT
jgi:hypothetical protein